jgi:hypothetical protein
MQRLAPFLKAIAAVQPTITVKDRLLTATMRIIHVLARGVVPVKVFLDHIAACGWLPSHVAGLDQLGLLKDVNTLLVSYRPLSTPAPPATASAF